MQTSGYNIYTYNQFGGDVSGQNPQLNANGLPNTFPAANLPTSIPGHGDSADDTLTYHPAILEMAVHNPGAVPFVAATNQTAPSLWGGVANALFGGAISPAAANTALINNAATNQANAQGVQTAVAGQAPKKSNGPVIPKQSTPQVNSIDLNLIG